MKKKRDDIFLLFFLDICVIFLFLWPQAISPGRTTPFIRCLLRPCCICEPDGYRSGATDARACRVDPSCLGVAETVLPLRRGGSGSTYAPLA